MFLGENDTKKDFMKQNLQNCRFAVGTGTKDGIPVLGCEMARKLSGFAELI